MRITRPFVLVALAALLAPQIEASRTSVWASNPPASLTATSADAAGLLASLAPAGPLENTAANADLAEPPRFDLGDVVLVEGSLEREGGFDLGPIDLLGPTPLRGPPPSYPETRVRGFELLPPFRVGASATLSLWPRQACGFSCREVVSDSRYDPWGLAHTDDSLRMLGRLRADYERNLTATPGEQRPVLNFYSRPLLTIGGQDLPPAAHETYGYYEEMRDDPGPLQKYLLDSLYQRMVSFDDAWRRADPTKGDNVYYDEESGRFLLFDATAYREDQGYWQRREYRHQAMQSLAMVKTLQAGEARARKRRSTTGDGTVKPNEVHPYGTYAPGLALHHAIMDAWAKENVAGYVSRAADNPTVSLSPAQHEAANAVFRDWMRQRYGKPVGVKVDWKGVTPREIQRLTEHMMNAAQVPATARTEYYKQFHRYIYR